MSRALRPGLIYALTLVLAGASLALMTAASSAQAQTRGRVVSETPATGTPDVLGEPDDEHVYAIAKVGQWIVLGGDFSKVSPAGSDEKLTRHNILAFNAKTGAVSTAFAPNIDGPVKALAPAPSGEAVFVGGEFTNVNGHFSRSLAKLKLSTGKAVAGFHVPTINGQVRDIEVSHGRLYVSGDFTWFENLKYREWDQYHPRVVTLDPQTGKVQDFFDIGFTGTHRGSFPSVRAFDVSPDGNRMVAIGNFDTVSKAVAPGDDGEAPAIAHREQIAMIDLSGSSAQMEENWATDAFETGCYGGFNTYMRDVAFSPGGSYFVVATTGGGVKDSLCDTATRWESDASGADVEPTWIAPTGGDTLLSVAVTGSAVYVGGHQRWFNNPFGVDEAREGAVARPGLAALDPENGLPLQWNPGRIPAGYGATDLLVTERGLWVGSDTEWIGDRKYHRGRIAFFPFKGGNVLPQATTGHLPGDVYLVRPSSPTTGTVTYRPYDGDSVGKDGALAAAGLDGKSVRGAVLIGDTLWYGTQEGNLVRRAFDGQSLGKATTPDPYSGNIHACHEADEEEPGGTCSSGVPSKFYGQISDVTGLFYANGRLYYTLDGKRKLCYRYFTPSSAIVGAKQYVADKAPVWASVQGMFLSGGDLYYASDDGDLHRVAFSNGAPSGQGTVVESSKDWAANALFLRHDPGSGGGNPSPDPTGTVTTSPSPDPTGTAPTSPSPDPTGTATSSPDPTGTGGDGGDEGGNGDETGGGSGPSPTSPEDRNHETGGDSSNPSSPAAGGFGGDSDGDDGAAGGAATDDAGEDLSLASGGSSGGLPYTGFEFGLLVTVALASLAIGIGCVLLTGRRFTANT